MGCSWVTTHQRSGAIGLHHVAGIDEPQPHAAGERRGDVAVGKLDPVELHQALVGLDRSFILQHGLFLVVQGLLGDCISGPGIAIAFQVHLGLREGLSILLQGALGLR